MSSDPHAAPISESWTGRLRSRLTGRGRAAGRASEGAVPWGWVGPSLALFAAALVIPLIMTLLLTFYNWAPMEGITPGFHLANWREVLSDEYFIEVFLRTLRFAALSSLICLVFGLPEAIIISRMSRRWRRLCLLVILGPLLVSVVVRTLGWTLLFGGTNGIVNQLLIWLGLIKYPLPFMFTETGTVIALAHVMMPFMVLAISASLQRIQPQVEDAAASLGAPPRVVMRRIVLPQIMPGLLSGTTIVFAMAASSFATPSIIGGRRLKVASTLIHDEFTNTLNWPLGAVVAVLLLISLVTIIVASNRLVERRYAETFK